MSEPNPTTDQNREQASPEQKQQTTPAEEWGEGLDTGKKIAKGGKTEGHVPGAEPSEKLHDE